MKLECVQVCVGYADFLAASLPFNKQLFNRQVIVTTPADTKTVNVCKHYNVECFQTDVFTANGNKFNKGAAINAALEKIDFQDWCIHMDADVVLPALTRHILETIQLNEQFLYGVDRLMVPSYEHWQRFLSNPLPQHDMAYVHVGPYPVGVRVMKLENNRGGWCPLGYFQMFNRKATALKKGPWYPTEWDTAATSDLHFAYKWPRTHRHLLAELLCYHLGTEDSDATRMGQNWEGRKTGLFEIKDPFLCNTFRPKIVPDQKEKQLAANTGSVDSPAK